MRWAATRLWANSSLFGTHYFYAAGRLKVYLT